MMDDDSYGYKNMNVDDFEDVSFTDDAWDLSEKTVPSFNSIPMMSEPKFESNSKPMSREEVKKALGIDTLDKQEKLKLKNEVQEIFEKYEEEYDLNKKIIQDIDILDTQALKKLKEQILEEVKSSNRFDLFSKIFQQIMSIPERTLFNSNYTWFGKKIDLTGYADAISGNIPDFKEEVAPELSKFESFSKLGLLIRIGASFVLPAILVIENNKKTAFDKLCERY